jgi:hypothetical protein
MLRASTLLMPKKARLQQLADGVAALEAQLQAASRIPVLRVARCGHDECGCPPPAQLPGDALLIEMGCRLQIPQVALPAGEAAYRSRSERTPHLPPAGRGLGTAGVARTLQKLRVIPLR